MKAKYQKSKASRIRGRSVAAGRIKRRSNRRGLGHGGVCQPRHGKHQ